MVDLMHCLTNLLLFDIRLLYYDTNLNLPIIRCLFSGDIYLSFGICVSWLALLFWEYNSFGDFKILVILSGILFPINSPDTSAVFWIALFKQFLLQLL